MTIQQFVVRLAPITSQPLLVDATSLRDGQLKAIVGGETKTIGVDFFRASEPVTQDIAHKIVQEYAKKHGLDEHSILVRSRLPKTNVKPRKTNDANLSLVPNKQYEQPKKEENRRAGDLTNMAQALQDAHDKAKVDAAVKPLESLAKDHKKASAISTATTNNPQGAVVKRTEEEKKHRRTYVKKDKERSAKSKAAYERYIKELNANASAASPTFMEQAKPGVGVTDAEVDDATMALAIKLAKLLKNIV